MHARLDAPISALWLLGPVPGGAASGLIVPAARVIVATAFPLNSEGELLRSTVLTRQARTLSDLFLVDCLAGFGSSPTGRRARAGIGPLLRDGPGVQAMTSPLEPAGRPALPLAPRTAFGSSIQTIAAVPPFTTMATTTAACVAALVVDGGTARRVSGPAHPARENGRRAPGPARARWDALLKNGKCRRDVISEPPWPGARRYGHCLRA